MTTSQQRAQRFILPLLSAPRLKFKWEAESNGKRPRAMLTKWLGSNYDEYFRSSNLAEVVERFRQELRVAGFHGCTIDEIQTEITSLISNDPILQWLQPGRNGESRVDMLMSWLGENYTGYAEAKLAKDKDVMLDPLVAQIKAVGFTNCKPRDLRLWITRLEKEAPSPLLRKFEPVLQTIFSDGRRKTRTRATKSKRRRLSTSARRRPETRESRGEDTTEVLPTASDSDHGSADIKTETGFQDGSAHAPLAVYDEGEGESLSTVLPIGEINRRAALFDARLKFGRKKTLSQAEIDLYFPKPET